jgi:hypothetical protein
MVDNEFIPGDEVSEDSPVDELEALIMEYERVFDEPVRWHRGYPRDLSAWEDDITGRLRAAITAGQPDSSLHRFSVCAECGTRWNSGEGCIVVDRCPRCGWVSPDDSRPREVDPEKTRKSLREWRKRLNDIPGRKLRSFFDETERDEK